METVPTPNANHKRPFVYEDEPEVHIPVGAREPELDAWDALRPAEVAARLEGVDAPWYVAAGWAISLFLGEEHREHEDLEIAVPADRFDEVRSRLDGFDLYIPGQIGGVGYVWPIEHAGNTLESRHQTWVRDRSTSAWRLDVFREPSHGDEWVSRRHESIRLPYAAVIARTSDGVPYARPEIVLLFKAKHVREKDQVDFDAVAPQLDDAARRWLADAIDLCHPGHAWLERLR